MVGTYYAVVEVREVRGSEKDNHKGVDVHKLFQASHKDGGICTTFGKGGDI